ncbi:hypothetical protein [Brachyspira alvinipulli]|uniref:hypothetical protein n=1 Tax=Brachyspira alvinipulli TaxID=84379 RepID=UPI0004851425|nr:hypothetical protein [Brachyspira alvinipulli]
MDYLYSKPINLMLSPSLINHSIIEDADGNKIDLNNLNSTELNNNIIKCLSKRIDFLENRVDFLEENQKKILKLLIDTINTDIKSIERQLKKSDNISKNFDANINAIDKKEVNRRNLYPDRINSSVRKK